jgi:hypothetical protein
MRQRHPPRRLEQELAGPRCPAAEHDLVRIERVDRVGDAKSDALGPGRDHMRGGGIAGASGPNDIVAQHGLARRPSSPERRLGLRGCGIRGQPVKRRPRGDTLKRPWLWEARSGSERT